MFCNKCGTQLNENASFCPQCGNPVREIIRPKMEGKNMPAKLNKGDNRALYGIIAGIVIVLAVIIVIVASGHHGKENDEPEFQQDYSSIEKASANEIVESIEPIASSQQDIRQESISDEKEPVVEKDDERITIENAAAMASIGRVSFDITMEEFVDRYNQSIDDYVEENQADKSKEYRDISKELGHISLDSFLVNEYENAFVYAYTYEETLNGDEDAGFVVKCEKESGKIMQVQYMVNEYLFDSGIEEVDYSWGKQEPYRILSIMLPASYDLRIEEGKMGKYEKGVLLSNYRDVKSNVSDLLYENIVITACTEDSDYYKSFKEWEKSIIDVD